MADIFADGNTRVSYVPTIANIAAPTTTELNAGTLLHDTITADGLVGFEAETAEVDTTALSSTFDTKLPGRASFSGTMLRLKKQNTNPAADTVFNLLATNVAGYIAIRRSLAATTAWASSQKLAIYPIQCGEVKFLTPEANTVERYEVPTMITATPQQRAVVA